MREEDIRADVQRLQEQWQGIEQSATDLTSKASGAAVALYEEPDVLVKVVRDLFNEDFSKLIIEGDAAWDTIDDYVRVRTCSRCTASTSSWPRHWIARCGCPRGEPS
ncbi:Possible ribonuclease E Rne [Mycobacteroides abscessus subsp. abscessus]|nr:Possible ribonuclease E Rne [Mycobacteroides abscessus subsp. abscessus]